MDAAMAATIALKEQTKNRMNFETGYLFCHVETKSSNVCSGIFCFSDLFGITSIVPRGAGGSRFSAIDTATAPVLHWNRGCTILWQYRIILSADTASEVRQLLSQKRR